MNECDFDKSDIERERTDYEYDQWVQEGAPSNE